MNVRTDTSLSIFACPKLGSSYFTYLRLSYAAVAKSPPGTQARAQSEESSSKNEGHLLYLSNA